MTTDASGRRVMAKVAGDPEQAARLRNEATLLEAGRHPGVAELVGVEGHGVGSVLLTAHVDGPNISEMGASLVGSLPLEEAAGLIAALATIVADLHDLGLVHGALCPDHVVIGPEGRPVLCSLGYGGRTGERPPTPPALPDGFVDPARAALEVLDPAIDVFGLGALARFLVPSPPPGHALARVVLAATSEDPSVRPTARALAGWLHGGSPTARLPRRPVRQPAPAGSPPALADPLAAWRQERGGPGHKRPPWREGAARHPIVKVLAGVAAAVVVSMGALALMAGTRPAPGPTGAGGPPPVVSDEAWSGPPTTRAGPSPSTTPVTSPATTSTPAKTPDRRECPPVTAVLQADVDGDGCPDAMRYAGGILEGGGVKWTLGQAGDQVATGDWGCQGRRTVALFRPSTGELFRFDAWASPGRDLTAAVVARVQGGQLLRAADMDRDGCHEAVVERGSGLPPEVIRLPPARR